MRFVAKRPSLPKGYLDLSIFRSALRDDSLHSTITLEYRTPRTSNLRCFSIAQQCFKAASGTGDNAELDIPQIGDGVLGDIARVLLVLVVARDDAERPTPIRPELDVEPCGCWR